MNLRLPDAAIIQQNVRAALAEDIGSGDITARLIPEGSRARARVITREAATLSGSAWFDEVFRQIDAGIAVHWHCQDGDRLTANQTLVELDGNARALLTGERSALNFVQLLSGTATRCRQFADLVDGLPVRLLDTRKTIPGLRIAQKYAVRCGGCHNHRIGLYDAFLIKENHIAACGSITAAIRTARGQAPGRPIEIEVENLVQLDEALRIGVDSVLLDNFTPEQMREAVACCAGRARLEASGGISESNLRPVAETGVDFISLGTLTKDCRAIDLSMRILQ